MTNDSDSSQLEARAVPPGLASLLAGRPDLAEKYQHFQNAFHEEGALDARLLELCRARIDALHAVESTALLDADTGRLIATGQFSSFSSTEQQALGVAEQLAIDAHGVTDEQVTTLNDALGEAAAVSLLTAVSMHDAGIRTRLVLESLNSAGSNAGSK